MHTHKHKPTAFRKLKWWSLECFFPSLESVYGFSFPGSPQGPRLGKALSPQSSAVPSSGKSLVGWGDGFHRIPDEWGAGDRSQLILLRIEHETSVFSVFTARTLLIPLPSLCLERWYKIAWMKESSAFFKLYVYWSFPECDMHGHSKWCFLLDSWTDILFCTILYLF